MPHFTQKAELIPQWLTARAESVTVYVYVLNVCVFCSTNRGFVFIKCTRQRLIDHFIFVLSQQQVTSLFSLQLPTRVKSGNRSFCGRFPHAFEHMFSQFYYCEMLVAL